MVAGTLEIDLVELKALHHHHANKTYSMDSDDDSSKIPIVYKR